MGFDAELAARSAGDYADFFLPHLTPTARVLDAGCGRGTIAVGLASAAGSVVGVDAEDDFSDARRHALEHGITNVEFRVGDVYALDLPDESFDACFCHSVLEALERPLDALRSLRRVLVPGGVLGAACVEYGGLVIGGPEEQLLRRFYEIRERLWLGVAGSDPYRGRALRGLLHEAGFVDVLASTKSFSYGTAAAVESFGQARAADCRDEWYSTHAQSHGLATRTELEEMERAWRDWSIAPDAYLSFSWCRAVGVRLG
jgi:ubiquinone/menaquinone biosynthesis C-methylase UbiE